MLKPILSEQEAATMREVIAASLNIVVTCHKSPDGDALGSSLAWAEYLRNEGKEPVVIVPDAYPDFLQWMPNTEKIIRYDKHPEKCDLLLKMADLIFCMDFNESGRTDNMLAAFDASQAKKVMIDHHLKPQLDTVLTISHPESSSTSELVFRIVWQLGAFEQMGKTWAVSVYCGIMTDTGGFTYNSSEPDIYFIQQREYVHKGDKKGEERIYTIDTLKGKQIKQTQRKEMAGSDKGKLLPTDIGIVVNDFLMKSFPTIMDYNFTAKVEQDFDKIAEGDEEWTDMMKNFYKTFEPVVEKTMNARQERKAGERQLGKDPKSGKPVFVKIGRFGPVVQIGSAEDIDKPLFAQLPSDKSMETLTLEEALELFKLPRTVGDFEGAPVVIGAGRFGPYILHKKKYTSLPKGADPMTVTLDEAIRLINEKRLQENQKHMKTFPEDMKLEVLNGRYGPYLAYDGKNYRMPKALHSRAAELTYDECMEIIEKQNSKS